MVAIRWYLRYNLSYRDVEELLAERGRQADHVTVYRWVRRFTPLLINAAPPWRAKHFGGGARTISRTDWPRSQVRRETRRVRRNSPSPTRLTLPPPKCFALPPDPDVGLTAEVAMKLINEVRDDLARLKWFCWHGNVFRALTTIDGIIIDLETLQPDDEPSKLLTAIREFNSYLRANADRIPNYGERRRAGEAISTAFTESTVNQVISKRMVKKQQMRWTPRGAHLLLQIRTRVLNDQLSTDFHRWYPNFTRAPDAEVLIT
jgi:hypothetical protein